QQILALVERNLQGQKLDLLFIDGDHGYDGVKADFEAYRQFLREGAIVAFHDIVPDYGARKGLKTDKWAGGVPIFWREVKNGFLSWELVENSDQDAFGIGLLEYRSEPQPLADETELQVRKGE
ncbi:MAG: class I SAM-dependent methyltransferase, partial [Candidatus Obscuribacterales bacterium]|nr:class I SAM-dependent methyltransferase [Candidatus Obscuribacterales bacterium]